MNQLELNDLYEKQSNIPEKMNFLVKPKENGWPIGTVTSNGQFKVNFGWEPEEIESSSRSKFSFDIMDIYLKNKPVSVNYDFSIIHDEKEIFSQSGRSTDSRNEYNAVEFFIPKHVSGPITVKLQNIDDNELAKVEIPLVVFESKEIVLESQSTTIPDWIRNNAKWWAEGSIEDNDFTSGIEFMIKEKIINIPKTTQSSTESEEIPSWIKNNADWWAQGLISDDDFVKGIQFLVENGIIKV